MRLFFVLLLLQSCTTFAQPLTLKIDAITSKDTSEKERVFTINYQLKNNTDDTLNFFFEPKKISPSTGGSMTKEIYYKIFEDDKLIEIGAVFNQFTSEETDFNFDETISKEQRDSIIIAFFAKKVEEEPAKLFKIFKEKGTEGLLDPSNDYIQRIFKKNSNYYHTLFPHQTEHFEATFKWNKNRYYYNEPNEFYLDINAKHYFEITLVALKEEFKGKVDDELFEKIMKNPNFIKGVFVSSKVQIDFSGN
jgi:hypothetical protein